MSAETTPRVTVQDLTYFAGPEADPCKAGRPSDRFVLTDKHSNPLRFNAVGYQSVVVARSREAADELAAALTEAGLKTYVFDKRPEES